MALPTFMDLFAALSGAKEAAQARLIPLSALLLVFYPVVLLVWTALEGRAAAKAKEGQAASQQFITGKLDKLDHVEKPERHGSRRTPQDKVCRSASGRVCILAVAAVVVVACVGSGLAFAVSGQAAPGPRQCPHDTVTTAPSAPEHQVASLLGSAALPGSCNPEPFPGRPAKVALLALSLALIGGAYVGARRSSHRSTSGVAETLRSQETMRCQTTTSVRSPHRPWETVATTKTVQPALMHARSERVPAQLYEGSLEHATNLHGDISLWHDVSLYDQTWLDEATGLYHYVNEIPRGRFHKWEVQTKKPLNVIAEHVKGTKKLQEFGRAVPFNYGCFPQTYRDPKELCEIYKAPGDDDPLDVIELTPEPLGVGTIARCRPLGAVCLIDEGRADWKVFVVNVEAHSQMARARSMEDVERIAPGRLQEVMQWLRDFKMMSCKDPSETTLHMEIHSADHAKALIEADHASWINLVSAADADGTAAGHWIREPIDSKAKNAHVLKNSWPKPACATAAGAAAAPHRGPSSFAGKGTAKTHEVREPAGATIKSAIHGHMKVGPKYSTGAAAAGATSAAAMSAGV
mmetsp:Transcript_23376/g.54349  ORF Transcript_23376/g.54349 Transcript_23376/m.54349 type:complete len:577 (+) Transcript_23376:49-1779(+)